MNHALSPLTSVGLSDVSSPEDLAHMRRLRALLGLFALYATALMMVMLLSDGADVGCILAGIAGHVFYATHRIVTSWRDASWLHARREDARMRALLRARAV